MHSDRPIPVVIYAAKSSQDVHGSIETQIADCRQFAEREGWTVAYEDADEGFSAYSGNRGPGLERTKERAAALAAEHGKSMLLAQHSDRFARGGGDAPTSAQHLGEIFFWASRHGVRLRTVQDDSMVENALLAVVAGMRNFEDSKRKSAAVKAGHRRRVERGQHHGGPVCLGYELRDGHRVRVEAEAITVNRMFAEAEAGKSQRAIAKDLDRDGVRTKRGGRWSKAQVARVLRNHFYIGMVTDADGNEHPGEHDPIVDRDLFERVQLLLSARARTIGKGRGGRPRGAHLFVGGLLKCGHCHESMLPRTLKRGQGLYEVYLCSSRVRYGKEACPRTPVRRRDVDDPVFDYLRSVVIDFRSIRDQVTAEHERRKEETQSYLEQAEADEGKAEARLARIRRDYIEAAITAAEMHEFEEELRDDLAAMKAKVALMREQLDDLVELGEPSAPVVELIARLRAAVSGRVQDAPSLDSLRGVLLTTFQSFELHETHHVDDLLGNYSDFELHPVVRPEATRMLEQEGSKLAVLRGVSMTVLNRDEANIARTMFKSSDRVDENNIALTT